MPLHTGPAESRKPVLRLCQHVRVQLGNARMGLDNHRRDPEPRFKPQLRDSVRQILHAVGEKTVRLPLPVGILPAVVNDNLLHMF